QELDGSNTIKREYMWGDSIDELLSIRQNGQMYFVHENSIGSVAAITDSTGALIERYDYDVFGKPTITYASGTPVDPTVSLLGQPYSFQNRELDIETGLFYFRARYYSAELGRFISQDPIPYVDGPSLYAFVGNSPPNWRDPLGLQTVDYQPAYDPGRYPPMYDPTPRPPVYEPGVTPQVESPGKPTSPARLPGAGPTSLLVVISRVVPAVGVGAAAGYVEKKIFDLSTELVETNADAYVAERNAQIGQIQLETKKRQKALEQQKTYAIYVLRNAKGEIVYVGRASGIGTPEQVVKDRIGKGHHVFDSQPGLVPEVIDVQSDQEANKGAEQLWYEHFLKQGEPLLNDPKTPPLSQKPSKAAKTQERIDKYKQQDIDKR
ncbi:MAG: hypothetical protein MN733_38130, partial [Nitrososphaera sp.]|nr:hypothetical protein [Nitrososphaera sp.]